MLINPFDSQSNKINVNGIGRTTGVNSVNGVSNDASIFSESLLSSANNDVEELEYLSEEEEQRIISELQEEVSNLEASLETTQETNGFFSGIWDGFKNFTGIGASSNKAHDKIDALKEELAKLEDDPEKIYDVYKNITGRELTEEEFEKIQKGEISVLDGTEALSSVSGYQEGQKMAVDVFADIVSGIAAVAVVSIGTAAGICAAPFTAGASLGMVAAGIGLAAGTGAVTKTAIKAFDAYSGGREYTLQNLGYDSITGSINGAISPVSNAIGGAAGTAVMKAAGMNALETTVVKQGVVKAAAVITETAVDSTISSAADGLSRAVAEGRYEDIASDTLSSAAAGLAATPIIGGGKLFAKSGITKVFAREVSEEVVSRAAQEVGEEVAEGAVSRAAQEAGEEVAEGAVSRAAQEVGEEVAEGAVSRAAQEAGEEVAEGAVSRAAQEVGEEVAEGAVSRAAQESGEEVSEEAVSRAAQESGEEVSEEAVSDINGSNTSTVNNGVSSSPTSYTKETIQEALQDRSIDVEKQGLLLKNTKVKTMSLEKWLKKFGVTADNIAPDAFEFFEKLDPAVVSHMTALGEGNSCIPDLLTKSGMFEGVDFSLLSKNAELLNYLGAASVDGTTLLSKLKDISFLGNPDFDSEGMKNLIDVLKNTRITEPVTGEYNYTLFEYVAYLDGAIDSILNNDKVNYSSLANFLEQVSAFKIVDTNGVELDFADIIGGDELYKSMFYDDIDYDKTAKLLKNIAESEYVVDMTDEDIDEILDVIRNFSSSKYSSPDEYFEAYKYFKELTNVDGEDVFKNNEDRMSHSEVINYLLSIDPSSIESSNLEMLAQLVKDGVVDNHVFKYLPQEGKINPAVTQDIDKLYNAYMLGVDPIDAFVPTFDSLDEAMSGGSESMLYTGTYKELKVGDVFQVDGEDFVRIKTSDTESEMLKLTRDKYFELFPPIERYASTQNRIGNCWEITGINTILCDPDTRVSVFRLFSQDGDDVIIQFPNGRCGEIRFTGGQMPAISDPNYYSEGALGVQMLEFADGKEMQQDLIETVYERFNRKIHDRFTFRKDYFQTRPRPTHSRISSFDSIC